MVHVHRQVDEFAAFVIFAEKLDGRTSGVLSEANTSDIYEVKLQHSGTDYQLLHLEAWVNYTEDSALRLRKTSVWRVAKFLAKQANRSLARKSDRTL